MTDIIIIGAVGAIGVLLVFAAGAWLGWTVRKRIYRAVAKPPQDDELRRLEAEQNAFRALQQYTADTAYGVTTERDKG